MINIIRRILEALIDLLTSSNEDNNGEDDNQNGDDDGEGNGDEEDGGNDDGEDGDDNGDDGNNEGDNDDEEDDLTILWADELKGIRKENGVYIIVVYQGNDKPDDVDIWIDGDYH